MTDEPNELLEEAPQTAMQKMLGDLDQIVTCRKQGLPATKIAALYGITPGRLSQLKRKNPDLAGALDTLTEHPEPEPDESQLDGKKPIGHPETLEWISERVARGVGSEAIAVLLGLDGAQEFERVCKDKPEVARAVKVGKARGEDRDAANLARILNDTGHREHLAATKYKLSRVGHHWAPVPAAKTEGPKQAVDDEPVLSPQEIMARLAGKSE